MEKRIYYKMDFNIEGKNVLGMVKKEGNNNIIEVKVENKVYNKIYNGNIYDADNMLFEIVKLMDDENI